MLAPGAHAGLGEVRVLSAAGEPFLAEIPLLDEPGLTDPYASLASSQQYPFLESFSAKAFQLKIMTVEDHPGQYVVRVMGPVMAPDEVLDFALELAWASGREVRAYHAQADTVRSSAGNIAVAGSGLPGERTASAPAADFLAFGEARLLSATGLPLQAEIDLLGSWPAELRDEDFVLRLGKGMAGDQVAVRYHQAAGHQWVTLHGQQALTGGELAFVLETHAHGLQVQRSYRLAPVNAAVGSKQPPHSHAVHAGGRYQVRAGDTLSEIVSRLAEGTQRRNELALQIVRNNAHAFVDGDPNRLLAGAWLRLPGQASPRPTLAVPAPAKAVGSAVSKTVPAHVDEAKPSAAERAQQEAERQRILHLHQAQQRIAQLEAEIRRIAATDREPAQPPKAPASSPTVVAKQDEDLLVALDDWVLTGIGGVSVLSLLAWAVWHRRKQQLRGSLAAAPTRWVTEPAPAVVDPDVSPVAEAGPMDVPVPAVVPPTEPEAAPEVPPSALDLPPAEPVPALPVTDVLAEVEVLLVYGRREQAEQMLRVALQQDPQADAVRYKLLELLAQAGATEPFEAEALDVLAISGPDSALWQRVQLLGARFDGGNPLYRAPEAVPSPVFTPPAAAEAFDEPQREPVRQIARKVNGNEAVPASALADTDDEAAALARLYREMGDSEMADALLKGDGD
ncbi:FimV family protein [Vogesella sp. GCM10023246]|uniref:FimV N-terminal domain-containing protein n=1 Tax=Vogesella oryzagri TaxID=3160864 RepID=A0ABV1M0D3_9NEIS